MCVFLVTWSVVIWQVCLTSSAGSNVGVKTLTSSQNVSVQVNAETLGYCFKYSFWYLRVWPFYTDNVVPWVKGSIVALQADAGLLRVHLTGEQWHRSRFRVCLWLLELNSMARHPASLTFCPLEPFSKTLVASQMYNNIVLKTQLSVLITNLLVNTFSFNFHLCGRVCCHTLNNLVFCIADSDSEEAREDTLSYSAWKRREGRPESVCPGGKQI